MTAFIDEKSCIPNAAEPSPAMALDCNRNDDLVAPLRMHSDDKLVQFAVIPSTTEPSPEGIRNCKRKEELESDEDNSLSVTFWSGDFYGRLTFMSLDALPIVWIPLHFLGLKMLALFSLQSMDIEIDSTIRVFLLVGMSCAMTLPMCVFIVTWFSVRDLVMILVSDTAPPKQQIQLLEQELLKQERDTFHEEEDIFYQHNILYIRYAVLIKVIETFGEQEEHQEDVHWDYKSLWPKGAYTSYFMAFIFFDVLVYSFMVFHFLMLPWTIWLVSSLNPHDGDDFGFGCMIWGFGWFYCSLLFPMWGLKGRYMTLLIAMSDGIPSDDMILQMEDFLQHDPPISSPGYLWAVRWILETVRSRKEELMLRSDQQVGIEL